MESGRAPDPVTEVFSLYGSVLQPVLKPQRQSTFLIFFVDYNTLIGGQVIY